MQTKAMLKKQSESTASALSRAVLRRFEYDDLPSVLAMVEKLPMLDWRMQTFMTCMREPYECWLAEQQEGNLKKIGFVIFSVFGSSAEVNNLYVEKEFQRRGFATALMHHAIDRTRARGAEDVTLEVRVSNETAQSLYRKLGFKRVGRIENYYETVAGLEDAYVMKLDLDQHPQSPDALHSSKD